MWKPLAVKNSQMDKISIDAILSGDVPAVVIKNFYDKKNCQDVVDRIKNFNTENFQNGKLKHIGPFLMAYTTKKKKYFQNTKRSQKIFDKIFLGMEKPVAEIYECIRCMSSDYSVSLAKEFKNNYSPFIIRIHKKGKSIPVHKDNVRYEGKEYCLSDIDYQLSCVLHLQESENGGDLLIYNKQWKKEDEKFRNIDFGYSSNLIASSECYKISNLNSGDLVIINTKYYHKVTKITGNTPRITLGMFLGVYRKDCKIVAWA